MKLNFKGIKVEFGFSFVLITTLMLLFFEERIVLLSVLSSVLHECGHLLMMKLCSEKIERVVFGAFGVRIEKYAFSGISYLKETAIALGGILINLILLLLALSVYYIKESGTALIFGLINLLIALMNSIPIGSLDMGKAVKFLLLLRTDEEKAEKISEIISILFLIVFSMFTVFYCVLIKFNFSLIAVCIYLLTETELKIHGQ